MYKIWYIFFDIPHRGIGGKAASDLGVFPPTPKEPTSVLYFLSHGECLTGMLQTPHGVAA